MSIPQSTISICSGVRLTNDYIHTIWFNSLSAQSQYFAGKVSKTFSAYTYLRKEWDIKVDATMEQARTWSYLYFRNGSGKTYYYFITNIQYENENTVTLKLELDVMQTYMFDYTLHPCFVDREHSETDAIGDNIIDEGLDTGDFIVNEKHNVDIGDLCVLVLSTFDPSRTSEEVTTTVLYSDYHGIFGGLNIYAVPLKNFGDWGEKLNLLDTYGKSDGIVSMWMYPKSLVFLEEGEDWNAVTPVTKRVQGIIDQTVSFGRNTTINGYSPKNKKLFTSPFNFMYISNNSGTGAAYPYEKFADPTKCRFTLTGCLSAEASVKFYPNEFKGAFINYEEGLMLGNFPTCAWNQDVYKLWLAQNQNQQNLSLLTAGATIGAGVGTAIATAGLGSVAGLGLAGQGVSTILNILAQRKDKAIQPEQSKGSYSASVNIVSDHQTFTVMKKSIDIQHAKIIDDFFSLYGYKTNRIKVPNRNVRQNWTYTKTVGCHVSGNLCTDDLNKIQSIYDNGVTFWVNGDNIGSYNLNNNVL